MEYLLKYSNNTKFQYLIYDFAQNMQGDFEGSCGIVGIYFNQKFQIALWTKVLIPLVPRVTKSKLVRVRIVCLYADINLLIWY